LSGGEQQMLTIARTLMGNPEIVLLDEPSEGLAPVIVQHIAATIRTLSAEGLTVLLSEQNVRFAMYVASRAAVIDRGRILMEGPIGEIAADARVREAYLTP
jgi:branched-chain amino acid transport system ATP-binding protein